MTSFAGSAVVGHLWQSTLVFGAIALLTRLCKDNRAVVRYCLWVVASLKFLVPLSAFMYLGGAVGMRASAVATPLVNGTGAALERILLVPEFGSHSTVLASETLLTGYVYYALVVVWVLGASAMLAEWWRQWRVVKRTLREAFPVHLPMPRIGVPVYESSSRLEPAVVGIWRQVLLLPAGIRERLSTEQLEAVIAHEHCHIRRHDNLFASAHQLVLTLFWFHPAVWYIGTRLIEERERACDEEVVAAGVHPETYAAGIVQVCRFYVESPLMSASGVTGSVLGRRVRAILADQGHQPLSRGRGLLLATAAIGVLCATISLGALRAVPADAAQTLVTSAPAMFDAASVKPSDAADQRQTLGTPGGGRFLAHNATVEDLIREAYNLTFEGQLAGLPRWASEARFDVEARAADDAGWDRLMPMLQRLLAERFALRVHRETKDMPAYALRIDRRSKLVTTAGECPPPPGGKCGGFTTRPGRISGRGVTLGRLAVLLSGRTGRPVIDDTNFLDRVDIDLMWTVEGIAAAGAGAADTGPSIFTALQDQLGLRLDPLQAPRERIVVDSVSRPTAN